MTFARPALALAVIGFWARGAFAQNQVVRDDFDWRVRSSEHFDIHYYKGSEALVPRAAEALEKAYARVTQALEISTEPPLWMPEKARKRYAWKKRPFFLFASPNDFTQNTIAPVGDGTGGITEPFKDRFLVYNDGSREWLDEVIAHEFVHVAQFHLLVSGFWRSGRILKTLVYPLWMIEGMAGYLTYELESTLQETVIRDAATSAGLIPLTRLEHFGHLKPHQIVLAYKQGAAACEFLASQYGKRKVGEMLRLFESRLETSTVLQELIGLDAFAFDKKYREYLETKYRREVRARGLEEPRRYGRPLTRARDSIPQFNSSPVFSPDGNKVYYVSTAPPYPARVRELDLATGKTRGLAHVPYTAIENLPMGNFANLSRVLDISPDGRFLVFAGSKVARDYLFFYDLRAQRLERRELPGFQRVAQPRWSPDGRRLVFSGMKRGFTDLYLYEPATGRVGRLTDDPNDDQMPVFTPDGRAVIYSSEVGDPLDAEARERRLYLFDLALGQSRRLEESGWEARDPVVSADGRRVLFVLDGDGLSELAELELDTGKVRRLTRSIGGSFTPAYAPDGELVFAALRGGSVHLYKGPRSNFLAEAVASRRRAPAAPVKFLLPGMGAVERSTVSVALSPERPYRFQYSTDLFVPALFYSSIGGFFWTSYWQGSDLLGRHQNAALVNFQSGRAYDYFLQYAYTRWRPQLFAAFQGMARRDLVEADTRDRINDAYHAQLVGVRYPFDRYHRVEAAIRSASERVLNTTRNTVDDRQGRSYTLGLARDTVRGRYLVATSGDREAVYYTQSVQALGGDRHYTTWSGEAEQYIPTGGQSSLLLRAQGVHSVGTNLPQFLLGGIGGVRGYARSTTRDFGSRLVLGTAEWRFPVLQDLNYHMWYFFPDFYFKAIYGTFFTDAGYAWSTRAEFDRVRWRDVRHSVGVGLRIYTFILQNFPLVVFLDYAHRTTQNGGIFYGYIGSSF